MNGIESASIDSLSVWDRAHRDLNNIREGLLKQRELLVERGRQAESEIAQIDGALSRIQPPGPSAMPIGPEKQPRPW